MGGHGGQDLLAAVETAIQDHFGHPPARASVSFVGVEPIEVLRFEPIPGERAYVTSGMSRYPMTGAAELMQQTDGPRAELLLHVRDELDEFADVWRTVAVLAASPSVEGVVYTDGMSVDTGAPIVAGSRCTGVVVVQSPLPPVTVGALTVDLLALIPATSNELAWCRVQGSAALRSRWTEQGVDLFDLTRAPAELSQ